MEKNTYYSIEIPREGFTEVDTPAEARKALRDGYRVEKITRTHIKSGKTLVTITVLTEIDDPSLL